MTRGYLTRLIIKGETRQLGPLPLQIELQGGNSGCDVRFGKLQLAAFMSEFSLTLPLLGPLLGLPEMRPARSVRTLVLRDGFVSPEFIDLARAACAADLLGNPGYTVRAVVRILGYASPSHLAGVARRVAGVHAPLSSPS